MAIIDDKIVAMSFENSKFQSGVSSTLSSLDRLKAALKFPGASKGLQDIDSASKRVNLGTISQGVEGVRRKLEALRLVAIGVFSNLTASAVRAGGRLLSAFTLDPLKTGLSEYETNLNAVQTILANTQAAGVGMKEVNATLKELNEYSDKTIYNFSQMARNIGTFTAAGVELDTATSSIKGIANLAALSGSNAEQASTAMYQLSQAIAAGSVKLMDWNSVVNAGMGGTVFQRALAQTAVQMGRLKEESVKLTGPMKNVSIAGEAFRNSLSVGKNAGWLDSKVLTRTLEQFTGDLSKAELKAQGFSDAQIKAIQKTADTAMKAATEVKTLTGVLGVAKEIAASGWAETWQIIFGNFGEAKKLFTGVSEAIGGFIKRSAESRNKVLSDWKELGGRTLLIKSIKTAFHNLGEAIKPIKQAFRDIFPATTGKDLFTLTQRFAEFTKSLKPGKETIENLRRTFRGLFALFSIGKQVIGGLFTVLGRLFGAAGEGRGSFLNFTGGIGDFLVSVDAALKKGDRLHNWFVKLGDILAQPIRLLRSIAEAIGDLFSGFSPGGLSGELNGITAAMSPLEKITTVISNGWEKLLENIRSLGIEAQPILKGIADLLSGLGTAIGQAASNMNFDAILQVIRTGLFAGIFVMFKKFLGKGSLFEQLGGAGGGILGNIAGSFDALRGSMTALQNNLKAKTLKEIAIAIALLSASVLALSFVDPDRLKSALAAMAVGFGQLLGAMAILSTITKSMGFIKLPFIAASLILLAGAIDVLAIAVIALSFLSWEQLLKGLGSVGVLLGVLSAASIPLSANSAGMIRAGVGIMAIALALKILASAVSDFGDMSWTELGKGMVGVAVGLGILAGVMHAMPKGMVVAGIGIIAVATGLKILVGVVKQFSTMNWKAIGKGLVGVGGALVVIAGAMHLMPGGMILMAAGLLLVSVALKGITKAVQSMAGMSIEEIARGLGTLAGSLLILAGALHLMSGTLLGAMALGVAAAGLALLAPAILLLGRQSWDNIIKGLVSLGGAMAVIGLAATVMSPAAPAMLAFGAALLVIGAGLALAGAGIALIGIGLSAIAVAGPTAIGILIAALTELAEAIPRIVKDTVLGILELVKAFAATAPQFVDAMVKILNSLLNMVIRSAPKMGEAFTALLNVALKVMRDNQGKIIQAGFQLILDLLKGLRNNIPALVTTTVQIITQFLNTLANNLGKIITAGGNILISLVKGITNHISNVAKAAISIVTRFLSTIASNLGRMITAGISIVVSVLKGIANRLGAVIKAGTDIVVKLITGIGNAGARIVTAAVQAITKFIQAIAKGSVKLVDEGMKAIIHFMNGVASAIEQNSGEMRAAGFRIGIAIIDGMTGGLASKVGGLLSKARSIASSVISIVKAPFNMGSPSRTMAAIGANIVLGLANGLDATSPQVYASAAVMSNGLIKSVTDVFQIASPSKVMYNIGKFVGQGFAKGLTGSVDDIKKSFVDMRTKLVEAMAATRETLKSELEKLHELRKSYAEKEAQLEKERAAKKPDAGRIKRIQADLAEEAAEIRKVQKVINENQSVLNRLNAAHTTLNKTLTKQKTQLINLANQYVKVTEKLKEAQKSLEDLKKIQADAVAGFQEQYASSPALIDKMTDEIRDGRERIAEEQKKLLELQKDQSKEITDQEKAISKAQDKKAKLQEDQAKAVAKQEEAILDAQKKQKKLEEAIKPDLSAIDDAREKVIEEQQKLADLRESQAEALEGAQESIVSEQEKLDELRVNQTEALASAQESIAAAQKSLDDLLEGKILDASGNSVDQLATYMQALKTQTEAVGAYAATLEQLRKLGLDDETYQKLLKEGTADQSFANQLLSGGKTAVAALNTLDSNLQTVSKTLAVNAGKNLYQAGIDAAQGLVNGLEAKVSSIRKQMERIAEEMIRALKKKLRIKSPSQEFAQIGTFAMEGMASGFSSSSKIVTDAIDAAGQDAMSAMRSTMRNISDVVANELNPSPVITPILDLTQVRSQSQELASLTTPLTATVSSGQAARISSEQTANEVEENVALSGGTIKFEQNNYSPEALTEIEIYRQTRNQLSQLKSVLSNT